MLLENEALGAMRSQVKDASAPDMQKQARLLHSPQPTVTQGYVCTMGPA